MSRIDEAYEEEYEESLVEDDNDAMYDGVIEFDLDDYEDSRSAGDDRKPAAVDDERKPSTEPDPEGDDQEEGFGVDSDGQMMTVQPKRPLCFKFYNTGQCTESGCKFSHDRQLATKNLLNDLNRLSMSPHNPNKAQLPIKKPIPGPRVSWPDDAVRRSTNPRLSSSGGRGGGRGTPPRILKRG